MSARKAEGAAAAPVDWRAPGELELTPILRVARTAFSESGFHATSVRDIARLVGVTVPALYYYHENKEAILFSLLDMSITRLHSLCEVALAEAGESPSRRFLNLVECIVIYMANVGQSANLDTEIRALSPDSRKVYSAKRHKIEAMLVDVIDDGLRAGIFQVTAPADTARALLGMYQSISTWFRPGGQFDAAEIAKRYKDISAHAVGATPEVIAQAKA